MRALAVVCSKCGSTVGRRCMDKGWPRDDPHRARVKHLRWAIRHELCMKPGLGMDNRGKVCTRPMHHRGICIYDKIL